MPSPIRTYPQAETIQSLAASAQHIVVMQADNPDADSLGSSLALEQMLGDMGKRVSLYCAIAVPTYLRYLPGWDRVSSELPKQFDLSIIVDASTLTLFDTLNRSGERGWVAAKPCIVIDHHASVQNAIDFASVTLVDPTGAAACEVIYNVATQLDWPVSAGAGACLMTGILADTQGLANDLTNADTYRIMADLVERGVNRPALEEQRREYNRMPEEIFRYKAQLIERTAFDGGGRIAHVTIPQTELYSYGPIYNPIPLIQNDMLATAGTALAIVFKQYDDGRTTGSIRANYGFAVADKVATQLGGGGNPYAAGFRVEGRPFNEIKSECLRYAAAALDNLDKEPDHGHQAIQHPDQTH